MRTTTTGYATLLLIGLASACAGTKTTADGATSDVGADDVVSDDSGTRDDGNRPDSQADTEQTPILERPKTGSYVCSVSRDATSHAPRAWTGLSALQVVADGSVYLARAEWDGTVPWLAPTSRSFVVSSLGLDGTLGSSTPIPIDGADAIVVLAAAPKGDGAAIVWADAQALRFAALDAKGALVAEPKTITTLDRDADSHVDLRMAAGASASGFALALSITKDRDTRPYALFLDHDGTARAPTRRLGSASNGVSSYYDPAADVIATTDGYAFVWSEPDATARRIVFSKTDVLGNQTLAPTVMTSAKDGVFFDGTAFVGGGARIVEIAGGFVAAWSETYRGEIEDGGYSPSKGGWTVVRLARLDPQGQVTTSATMRAPQNDVDEVEPVLTPFGETLAVAWGRGSHIYVCGGCVPDERIDFVLIDPASFTPVSNVVTVTNGGTDRAGGLLKKQVALTGSSFLTLYERTFHVTAEPGSAVFNCTR